MKLNIIKVVGVYDSKKDGSKLVDKYGKQYYSLIFKTKEHGEVVVKGFAPSPEPFKEGAELELDVNPEKQTFNGKEYWQFSIPNKSSELNKVLMRHEQEIGRLWEAITALQTPKVVSYDAPEVVIDEPLDFDESGAPLRSEPNFDDLKPLPAEDLPF